MTIRSRLVRVTPKLAGVLKNHRPTNIGRLWKAHIVDFPTQAPGYFPVVPAVENLSSTTDQSNVDPSILSMAFLDEGITPPFYFFQCDDVANVEESFSPRALFEEAIAHRDSMQCGGGEKAAYRLLNERYDRCPGITADMYGSHCLIAVYSKYWMSHIDTFSALLKESFSKLASVRAVDNTSNTSRYKNYKCSHVWGEKFTQYCEVEENDCKFKIDLNNGLSTGLFLDQTVNRDLIATLAPTGSSLLNLFAYTCPFSVVAAKKGKYKTTSVDISRHFLDVGYENFKRNDIDTVDHVFVKQDVIPFLVNARKKSIEYDIVVCDPPTLFNSISSEDGQRQNYSKKLVAMSCNKDYDELVVHAARIVRQGGYLVLFCNSKSLRKKKWLEMVSKGLQKISGGEPSSIPTETAHTDTHQFEFIQDLSASADFREDAGEPNLKGVLYRKVNKAAWNGDDGIVC